MVSGSLTFIFLLKGLLVLEVRLVAIKHHSKFSHAWNLEEANLVALSYQPLRSG